MSFDRLHLTSKHEQLHADGHNIGAIHETTKFTT